MKWDTSVKAVPLLSPGTEAAKKQFEAFVTGGLAKYDELRNDPNYSTICSNLSPWLNHGHISFQRCMMAIKKLNRHASGSAAFIEEGLIRRELSDNFLFYTPEDYDQLSCTAEWAQETLNVHSSDEREYLYSLTELEKGETHDDLWNAAQLQVVREGGMHGFLRMYWAKKILEWTESPEVALKTAQYFNDKYALDGRDPNGFVGVGWSIMGIHDQGWKEREIFGKIRYMNYNGCKRKFKIQDFVAKYHGAAENAIKAEAKHASTKRSEKKRKEPSS
jgi:deoxyribodipyrimidine photo-lyase